MNLIFTADASGNPADPFVESDLQLAMGCAPDVDEVWIAVHGWQTRLTDFVQGLARFETGILPYVGRSATRLSLGLHWPSALTENCETKLFDLPTYWMMERRADVVGYRALASLIESVIGKLTNPTRIVLVGHSFGCKAICSALDYLAQSGSRFVQGTTVVLIQAAFERDALEPGKRYGNVCKLPVRMMATRSSLDVALGKDFPAAALIGDPAGLFANRERQALGFAGPTDATLAAFGGRLVVADLTAIQSVNPVGGPSGSHSDIYRPEIIKLIADFVNPPQSRMAIAA